MDTGDPDVSFQKVGQSQPRVDGFEKVIGQAQFVADLKFGRMLQARVVRAAHAHATIRPHRFSNPGARLTPGSDQLPDRIRQSFHVDISFQRPGPFGLDHQVPAPGSGQSLLDRC